MEEVDGKEIEGLGQAKLDHLRLAVTRRQLGVLALGAALGVGSSACCADGLGDVERHGALELQRLEGWALGDESKPLSFVGTTPKDRAGAETWKRFLDVQTLRDALSAGDAWKPFERLDLFEAVGQTTLSEQIAPILTAQMEGVFARAAALVSLMTNVKDPTKTLLVLDMPGPRSVALAAGMAARVEPVFFFENWPHPRGVVRSHETLAAVMTYAADFEAGRKLRGARPTPVALVLDSRRLSPFREGSGAFDNRYLAKLPNATQLKRLGVSRVLYITEDLVQNELDDLNAAMVSLAENRVQVAALSIDSFKKDPDAPKEAAKHTGGFFYGGGYSHHPYFYTRYPMFLFFPKKGVKWASSPRVPPESGAPKPLYVPQTRQTQFALGPKGGLVPPPGFGEVYTRKGGDGARTRVERPQEVAPRSRLGRVLTDGLARWRSP